MGSCSTNAAARFNRNCECVGTDVPALRDRLQKHAPDGHALELGSSHPHLFSGLPVFVSRRHAAAMRNVVRAIESVVALPAYEEGALGRAPEIARIKCGVSAFPRARGAILGFDFHLTDTGPMLIEINTNPGGALLNAAASGAQRGCCAQLTGRAGQPRSPLLETKLLQTFLDEWRGGRQGVRLRSIAIVDETPEAQYLYPEFLLFKDLFERNGIATVIAAPEELEERNAAVWVGGRRIDLIYNRCTDFYLEQGSHAVLARAFQEGTALVTPHPRAHALYANKRNLCVFSDEAELRRLGVPESTRAVLLRHVPQTRHVSSRDAESWWSERKQWFFKPASGFGSRGSYRGDKVTRKVFAGIVRDDYVAQATIAPGERFAEDGGRQRALKFDVRAYAYGGESMLFAARLYQGQTTNFRTLAGGFAPVYMV